MNIDKPDWSQTITDMQGDTQSDHPFYERCLIGANASLPPEDQKALCACMAAQDFQDRSVRRDDEYWVAKLNTRLITPFEHFLTNVYAPCAYIELRIRAYDECQRQTGMKILFPDQASFEKYCVCYGRSAENYVKSYAQPLISAWLFSNLDTRQRENKSPSRIIMDDVYYNIAIDQKRQQCMERYSRQPNE